METLTQFSFLSQRFLPTKCFHSLSVKVLFSFVKLKARDVLKNVLATISNDLIQLFLQTWKNKVISKFFTQRAGLNVTDAWKSLITQSMQV